MATIQQNGAYTFVVEFETDAAKIEELIEGIAAVVEQSFRPDRRFISAIFHVSNDKHRVLNYAQWTSQADYEAFMNEISNDTNQAIGEAIQRSGAKPLGGRGYSVRHIVEGAK